MKPNTKRHLCPCKGHFLGVAASWLVQVGIECYRFVRNISKSNEVDEDADDQAQVKALGKKVYGVTIRCGASLVFASIGAGIGATLFRPSTGQSVGKHHTTLYHHDCKTRDSDSEWTGTK